MSQDGYLIRFGFDLLWYYYCRRYSTYSTHNNNMLDIRAGLRLYVSGAWNWQEQTTLEISLFYLIFRET